MKTALIVAVLCTLVSSRLLAYTTVTISTAAPAGTEKALIASVTAQFRCDVVPNKYSPSISQITVYGPNPDYVSPQVIPSTAGVYVVKIKADTKMVYQSTTSLGEIYVYGWSDGQRYERKTDLNTIGSFILDCSSPSVFDVFQSSGKPWDLGTCLDALMTVNNIIYQQDFADPTPITPGGF